MKGIEKIKNKMDKRIFRNQRLEKIKAQYEYGPETVDI